MNVILLIVCPLYSDLRYDLFSEVIQSEPNVSLMELIDILTYLMINYLFSQSPYSMYKHFMFV